MSYHISCHMDISWSHHVKSVLHDFPSHKQLVDHTDQAYGKQYIWQSIIALVVMWQNMQNITCINACPPDDGAAMQKTGNCQQHPQPVAASEKLEEHFLLLQRQLTLDNLQQSQKVRYVDASDTEHIILSTATKVPPQLACHCVHDAPDQVASAACHIVIYLHFDALVLTCTKAS